MTSNASQFMECILDCYKEPCCRSVNFKKISTSEDEPKCELLHNFPYNTSKNLLQGNASYDYAYFTKPEKVRLVPALMVLILSVIAVVLTRPYGGGSN